jgi:hypothetical protein
MIPETPAQRTAALIAEWARSPSRIKQVAAALAREMQDQRTGTPVESSPEIAARRDVSLAMAENAKRLLASARIIRSGPGRRHYIA